MRVSNFILIVIVLIGYLISFVVTLANRIFELNVPIIVLSVTYYLIFSIIYKKYRLLSFLSLTFVLLSLYLSFIRNNSLSLFEIISVYKSLSLPVFLYTNILLPMAFLSYTFDFFQLTREISSHKKFFFFRYLIPILIKRELILKRYFIMIDRLQTRGINSEKSFVRFFRMDYWMIPLITTTIIEGIESYEYNSMLNTDIMKYDNKLGVSLHKGTIVSFIIILLVILILIISNLLI